MTMFKKVGSALGRLSTATSPSGGGGAEVSGLRVVGCRAARAASVALPSGIVAGDLIVVLVSEASASTSFAAPSGYTAVADSKAGASPWSVLAFSKVADGTEASFSVSAATLGYTAWVYRGASGVGVTNYISVNTTQTTSFLAAMTGISPNSIIVAASAFAITSTVLDNYMFGGGQNGLAYSVVSNRRDLTDYPQTTFAQASGTRTSLSVEILAA